jgi:ADP-ribosyl-[dinitrogen reductase] hydrolase
MAPSLLDRVKGSIYGLAVGDALGGPLEMKKEFEVKRVYGEVRDFVGAGWLNLEPGETTDDTAMMMALADSLIEKQGFDLEDIAKNYLRWFDSRPKDIGGTTRRALAQLKSGVSPEDSGLPAPNEGNGTVMRCAPIGLAYYNRSQDLEEYSKKDAAITHASPVCMDGSFLVNSILAELLKGQAFKAFWQEKCLTKLRGFDEQLKKPFLNPSRLSSPSGHTPQTLQAVFWALLNSDSFEESLVKVVNLGGDADTTGAIAGAIAGAQYGFDSIPHRLVNGLLLKEELKLLSRELFELQEQLNP